MFSMDFDKMQGRVTSRFDKAEQHEKKVVGIRRHMVTMEEAIEQNEKDGAKAKESAERMQAVLDEAKQAQEKLQAARERKLAIIKLPKWSTEWVPSSDPDAPTLEKDAEYQAVNEEIVSLLDVIKTAEGRINQIFYGKA